MSDHDVIVAKEERFDPGRAAGLSTIFLGAAVLGLVGTIAGFFLNKNQFAFSYLFGFFFFFTLCCGSLFWILVHHGTDAEWSVVVRRILETTASLIPILGLLWLPLLLVKGDLWEWWNIAPGKDALLDAKRGFLNHEFFYIRLVLYFTLMGLVAWSMRRLSTAQDKDGSPKHTVGMRKWAFGGLPIFGVGLTFAAIDWLMAMDHHWFSTMWGVYIFAGTAGSAMSLLVLTTTWLKSLGYLNVVTKEHYHIMGKFMLAFTIFWAYIGFSQYMLIWYSNIPEETVYFVRRNVEGWWPFSQALVVCRFFIPFPFLLFQATKKTKWINFWACWVICMQLLDLFVVVMPMSHGSEHGYQFPWIWLNVSPLLAIGGILGFIWLRRLGQHNLYPNRDPRVELSMNLSN